MISVPRISNSTVGTLYSAIPAWRLITALIVSIGLAILLLIFVSDFFARQSVRHALLPEIAKTLSFGLTIFYLYFSARRRGYLTAGSLSSSLNLSPTSISITLVAIPILSIALCVESLFSLIDINFSLLPSSDSRPNVIWPNLEFIYVLASVIGVINTVILAPIVEEIFFRGFLLCRLRTRFNNQTAIIIVSVLFSLMHASIFGSATFSVVVCLIVIRSGALSGAILIHIANNAFVVCLILYETLGLEKSLAPLDFLDPTWELVAITAVIGIGGLYLSRQRYFAPKT